MCLYGTGLKAIAVMTDSVAVTLAEGSSNNVYFFVLALFSLISAAPCTNAEIYGSYCTVRQYRRACLEQSRNVELFSVEMLHTTFIYILKFYHVDKLFN